MIPTRHVRDVVLVTAVLAVNTAFAESNDHWDYPAGRSGMNQVSAGKADHLRVYDCETSDTVEQVVLWYTERLGLPVQNELVTAAKDGFDSLQSNTHIKRGFGYDTENRRDHTQLIAHLSSDGHAYVFSCIVPTSSNPQS